MLHILWELGRDDHQFRFRYRGQYLRDAYTFEVISPELQKILLYKNAAVDITEIIDANIQ